MFIFETPPEVEARYQELYDLIQNESEHGQLSVNKLAKYMHCSVDWLHRAICNGSCPFAFGDGTSGRSKSYIDIFPLWQFATQNSMFKSQQTREWRRKMQLTGKIRVKREKLEKQAEERIS